MILTLESVRHTRRHLNEIASLVERAAKKKAEPEAPAAPAASVEDVIGSLKAASSYIDAFLDVAETPLGPLEKIAPLAQEVAEKHDKGEAISGVELADINSQLSALELLFGKVYEPFVKARESTYAAAKAIGVPTRRTGRERHAPEALSGKEAGAVADGIEGASSRLERGIKRLLELATRTRNKMDEVVADLGRKAGPGWENRVGAAVDMFLDFRDAVGTDYYQQFNGVKRRINELDNRIGMPGAPARMRELPPQAA